MRIMGIDPGTRTGVSILDGRPGKRPVVARVFTIPTSPQKPLGERCLEIYTEVSVAIEMQAPAVVAIEDVFIGRGKDAAVKLTHCRAAALIAASMAGVKIETYANTTVKKAVTGDYQADKAKMRLFIEKRLRCGDLKTQHDGWDAVGIAMTAWQVRWPIGPAPAKPRRGTDA